MATGGFVGEVWGHQGRRLGLGFWARVPAGNGHLVEFFPPKILGKAVRIGILQPGKGKAPG